MIKTKRILKQYKVEKTIVETSKQTFWTAVYAETEAEAQKIVNTPEFSMGSRGDVGYGNTNRDVVQIEETITIKEFKA